MENNHLKVLKELARQFRLAIIECEAERLPPTLENFPFGACGDASLLLAKYLREHGFKPLYYVRGVKYEEKGENSKPLNHGWLEYKDIVIDITVSQFEEFDIPIKVSKAKSWHEEFEDRTKRIANFERYDRQAVNELSIAYNEIIKHL